MFIFCNALIPIIETAIIAPPIMIFAVSSSERKTTPNIAANNIPYLILKGAASNVSQEYGVRGIPAFFLINQDGKVESVDIGFQESYIQKWQETIDRLLG